MRRALNSGPLLAGVYIETRRFVRSLKHGYGIVGVLVGAAAYAAFFSFVHSGGSPGAIATWPTIALVVGVTALVTPLHVYPHVPTPSRTQWLLTMPGGERAGVAGRLIVSGGFCVVDAALAMVMHAARGEPMYLAATAWTIGVSLSAIAFRQVWYLVGRHLPWRRWVRWLVFVGSAAGGAVAVSRSAGGTESVGLKWMAAMALAIVLTCAAIALARGYLPEAAAAEEHRGRGVGGSASEVGSSSTGADRWQGDRAFLWLELLATRRALRRVYSSAAVPLVPALVAVVVWPHRPAILPLVFPFLLAQLGIVGPAKRHALGRAYYDAEAPAKAALLSATGRAPWFTALLVLAFIPGVAFSPDRAWLAAALLLAPLAAFDVALLHAVASLWGDRWRVVHWPCMGLAVAATAGAAAFTSGPVLVLSLALLLVATAAALALAGVHSPAAAPAYKQVYSARNGASEAMSS